MKKIEIKLNKQRKNYTVFVGSGILEKLSNILNWQKYSSIYIITDENVAKLHLSGLISFLKIFLSDAQKIETYKFPAGEKNKTLETAIKIYKDMAHFNIDKKALIINLGGGVVSDLGGFVASTFMRGLDFINIPTTLESMVDASIGGKTGVNLNLLKNYIGVIAQPLAVVIDTRLLKTLPKRALVQGYAEVIKHGLIYSKEYFDLVAGKSPEKLEGEELIEIIEGSIKIKADIVFQDEKEMGLRKLLNFGHTIGHAIESGSMSGTNPLFHGEAVAIGLLAEAHISKSAGMISDEAFYIIERALEKSGLPIRYKTGHSIEDLFDTMKKDKKNSGSHIKWTLLTSIGTADYNIEISEKFVREAILYISR